MSFILNPDKYLKEALQARREQQRARRRAEKEKQQHDKLNHKSKSSFWSRKNNKNRDETSSTKFSNIPFESKWKSISDIKTPTFLEKDDDDNDPMFAGSMLDNIVIPRGIVHYSSELEQGSVWEGDDPGPSISQRGMKSAYQGDREIMLATDQSATKNVKPKREIPEVIIIDEFGVPEWVPSEPVFFNSESDCWGPFRCHRYAVSQKLKSFERQTEFLKRYMTVMSLEYVIVILWTSIVKCFHSFGIPIKDNFNYSYIFLSLFVISKIILRSMVKIRKLHSWVLMTIVMARVVCIAYYCAAVTVFSKTDVVLLTASILLLSHLFFTVTPLFVEYEVTNTEIVGMAAVVNLMFATMLLPAILICRYEAFSMHEILIINWFPSMCTSQLIFMYAMFEMKQIMKGWRYPLTEADWIFTILYL